MCNWIKVWVAAIAAAFVSVLALAADVPFVDPSFENGGSTIMEEGVNYSGIGKSAKSIDLLAAGIWHQWTINDGGSGGLLEDKDSYKGFTTAPAGVSGTQFHTSSRTATAIFQYVNDGGSTKGETTFSVDYWAHELSAADPVGGSGDITFEVIAFNVSTSVWFRGKGTTDFVTGTNFVTSGDALTNVAVVAATTGFQTLEATVNLSTGYQYIGVVLGQDNFNDYASTNGGNVISFDNLRQGASGPPPPGPPPKGTVLVIK